MCPNKKYAKNSTNFYHNKLPSEIGTDLNYKFQIVWPNAIVFLILHISAFYGIYQIFHAKLITFISGYIIAICCSLGVLMGAHRYYTHRSFKAKWPLQLLFLLFHTIAGQNCMYIWVRDHRLHHKYSDTDADPHNANRGFFFSHMGWLMVKKHPAAIEKGRTIDLSDLEKDPFVMFQKKHYKKLFIIFGIFIPILIPYLCWNENLWNCIGINFFLRYVVILNITWCVNSIAHLYGSKPYDKTIKPVESTFVAILSWGEGWHNYHHAYPWDYRAAEFGVRYSVTTALIDFCQLIGLAYDLRGTKEEMIKKQVLKAGDGTHPIYNSKKNESDVSLDKFTWKLLLGNKKFNDN